MMERMGIAGHVSSLLADVIVGVLCGAAVLACTCGAMLPLLAYALSGGVCLRGGVGGRDCALGHVASMAFHGLASHIVLILRKSS